MKRFFIAVIVVAGAIVAAQQASAAIIFDSFRLQFSGTTIASRLADDPHGHYTDFRHYGDYYVNPGYGNPQLNTTCRETSVRGDDGRVIRRITCRDR